MNNTLYKLEKRRIKENGEHPWLRERKASVAEFGMQCIEDASHGDHCRMRRAYDLAAARRTDGVVRNKVKNVGMQCVIDNQKKGRKKR